MGFEKPYRLETMTITTTLALGRPAILLLVLSLLFHCSNAMHEEKSGQHGIAGKGSGDTNPDPDLESGLGVTMLSAEHPRSAKVSLSAIPSSSKAPFDQPVSLVSELRQRHSTMSSNATTAREQESLSLLGRPRVQPSCLDRCVAASGRLTSACKSACEYAC